MAYEQKDNTGSLFKNERKAADTHADYNGTITVGGVVYYQDAWINKDKNGKSYMSQKFKPKEMQKAAPPKRQVGGMSDAALDNDLDDSVPF